MKIEKFWEDIATYHVEFLTDNGTRKIDKLIVVKSEMPLEEITQVVKNKFSKVEQILYVDFWGSGLLLKEKEELEIE